MKTTPLPLFGLTLVETDTASDSRGAFSRFFCAEELSSLLGERRILQINHSRTSRAGAVRGLHFQRPPHAEMKFVRCLRGRVMDVAVDLRAGSPTFLRHHAMELSEENRKMLAIPEGFAHGFQALEDGCEMLYLHTAFYEKAAEGGLRHDDPAFKIRWTLPVTDISERDKSHPLVTAAFEGVGP
jgi:dTDP-4-dehydrorhamnose 3,5-epimerase